MNNLHFGIKLKLLISSIYTCKSLRYQVSKKKINVFDRIQEGHVFATFTSGMEKFEDLLSGVRKGEQQVVQQLLDQGVDINGVKKHMDGSCFGWCALGVAVDKKNESMAKFLVQFGADPNIKRASYKTLLSAAIRQSDMKAINFLTAKLGASPDTCFIPDQEGLDVYPVHLAIK